MRNKYVVLLDDNIESTHFNLEQAKKEYNKLIKKGYDKEDIKIIEVSNKPFKNDEKRILGKRN